MPNFLLRLVTAVSCDGPTSAEEWLQIPRNDTDRPPAERVTQRPGWLELVEEAWRRCCTKYSVWADGDGGGHGGGCGYPYEVWGPREARLEGPSEPETGKAFGILFWTENGTDVRIPDLAAVPWDLMSLSPF